MVKLGHLPLSEPVTSQHLTEYLDWLESVEPRLNSDEKVARIDLIVHVLSAAMSDGDYKGELPEKPIIPETDGSPEGGLPTSEEIKEILARQCRRDDELGAAWLLLKTVVGLARREILALPWMYAMGTDVKIHNIFVPHKGVRRATTRQARTVPLPGPLARLLLKLRAEATFSSDSHLVFAKSEDKATITLRFMERHLYAVTDKIPLPRRIFSKLENVAAVLGEDAGLTSQQIKNVLRVGRCGEPLQRPTSADLEAVRVAFEAAIRRVLPPELMYLCDGGSIAAPAGQALASANTKPPASLAMSHQEIVAKRKAGYKTFMEKKELSAAHVCRLAGVHRSDVSKYSNNTLHPPHSDKIKRLNKLFFDDPEAT